MTCGGYSRPMTDVPRSARARRGGRRPGWLLLTVLLVLAIGASSALVFTNRVELLKLAVILALWAAVVAAFVSVIYRRQSDMDQAKVRDLKLVYDLQLDREISARREYELNVETELRRELASELRAQAADEVAGLRAELAALRANLEILFDADLSHRPAIETERASVRAFSDWSVDAESSGRVTASRIDTEYRQESEPRTDESPIIDVSAEPHPPEPEWASSPGYGAAAPGYGDALSGYGAAASGYGAARSADYGGAGSADYGGAHRRPAEGEDAPREWTPAPPREEPSRVTSPTPSADWQPAPAEGQWTPAGSPGSNWGAPSAENGSSGGYVGKRRASESAPSPPPASPPPARPVMSSPPSDVLGGRHAAGPDAVDPGRPPTAPTPAAGPAAPPHPQPPRAPDAPRHRSPDDTGGQSVAELLARLQATPTGGGRRRRRED